MVEKDDRPLERLIIDERMNPGDDVLYDALIGAIGITEESHRIVALDGLDGRTFIDRVLSVLLGAYAVLRIEGVGFGYDGGWVARSTIQNLVGTDDSHIRGKLDSVNAVESGENGYRLKPKFRAVVADDLSREYGRNTRSVDTETDQNPTPHAGGDLE